MKPSRYLLFTTILLAAVLVPVAASQAAGTVKLTAPEQRLLVLINATRTRHHLAAVHVQAALVSAARQHSCEMMHRGYCSHSSANGMRYDQRLARLGYWHRGYAYWSVGEVIGWGKGAAGSALSIYRAWMASHAHRAVILNPAWRDIGIGRADGTFRGASGVTMSTVDFGRRTH
jgi:uncharacterized protein YkwD